MIALALAVMSLGQAPPVFQEAPPLFPEKDVKPSYSRVVVHTSPTCGPCQKWKKECMPEMQDAGWEVELKRSGGIVPRFEVHIGDFVHKFQGYSHKEGFYSEVRKAKRLASGKSPVPSKRIVRGYGRGGWTWPGGPSVAELEKHLARPPHNYDPSYLRGLNDAQLIMLHDSWHNRNRARAVTRTRIRSRSG